jgi:hypothetical protein
MVYVLGLLHVHLNGYLTGNQFSIGIIAGVIALICFLLGFMRSEKKAEIMKYRLLISELLFMIGCMIGIFALAYSWSNSVVIALGMAVGTFWVGVFASWLAHRSVKSDGDSNANCSSVVHFIQKVYKTTRESLIQLQECDRE